MRFLFVPFAVALREKFVFTAPKTPAQITFVNVAPSAVIVAPAISSWTKLL
jgi:hypothetical protein